MNLKKLEGLIASNDVDTFLKEFTLNGDVVFERFPSGSPCLHFMIEKDFFIGFKYCLTLGPYPLKKALYMEDTLGNNTIQKAYKSGSLRIIKELERVLGNSDRELLSLGDRFSYLLENKNPLSRASILKELDTTLPLLARSYLLGDNDLFKRHLEDVSNQSTFVIYNGRTTRFLPLVEKLGTEVYRDLLYNAPSEILCTEEDLIF